MENRISFKVIYLEKNQGHGNARRVGLANCSNELVALMDSDDISLPSRFYHQLNAFSDDNTLDIVGGQITEFIGEPSNIIGKRVVPEDHDSIKKYMKKRCPMNQVSVMFKKSSVENAGGYIDWFCEEDYYLWIRMFENGCKFKNIPETLVNVRIGNEMSARRGGWKYFKSERDIQRLLLKKKFINVFRYLYNVSIRFFAEVLVPTKLRTKMFRLARKKDDDITHDILEVERNNKDLDIKFSVSVCVYDGDNSIWFDNAIASIYNQSVRPNEIVLIVDGPVNSDLKKVINKWEAKVNGKEKI